MPFAERVAKKAHNLWACLCGEGASGFTPKTIARNVRMLNEAVHATRIGARLELARRETAADTVFCAFTAAVAVPALLTPRGNANGNMVRAAKGALYYSCEVARSLSGQTNEEAMAAVFVRSEEWLLALATTWWPKCVMPILPRATAVKRVQMRSGTVSVALRRPRMFDVESDAREEKKPRKERGRGALPECFVWPGLGYLHTEAERQRKFCRLLRWLYACGAPLTAAVTGLRFVQCESEVALDTARAMHLSTRGIMLSLPGRFFADDILAREAESMGGSR